VPDVALEIVEYTDPLCPWAWGSEPVFRRLREILETDLASGRASWRHVFGVLFDDDDEPAPDPGVETRWYHRHLAEISGHTGAPYPAVLERVARTSRPASRAVIAAAAQGQPVADRVLRRLREQMFLTGCPPDTDARVRACMHGVSGLDLDRLMTDAGSERVGARLARDWTETRTPVAEIDAVDLAGPHPGRAKPIDGGRRYAFPTLLVTRGARRVVVGGWRGLPAYLDAASVADDGRLADPELALRRHRSLTRPDLVLLCGADRPPRNGLAIETAGGALWLHIDDAAAHPVAQRSVPDLSRAIGHIRMAIDNNPFR
jgi:protein-disulfide isomerase-like protein with CxxC motif